MTEVYGRKRKRSSAVEEEDSPVKGREGVSNTERLSTQSDSIFL